MGKALDISGDFRRFNIFTPRFKIYVYSPALIEEEDRFMTKKRDGNCYLARYDQLNMMNSEKKKKKTAISDSVLAKFGTYPYLGNVIKDGSALSQSLAN